MDPAIYTEYYRKFTGAKINRNAGQKVKGSNIATNSPFDIGIIEEIQSDNSGKKVKITMKCLLRPEQVPLLDKQKAFGKDLNLVFWTNIQRKINPDLIEGKCFARSKQSILDGNETVESWTKAGEYRFYFNQFYDKEAKEITSDLPYKAEIYGSTASKGKKGKGMCSFPILF